MIFRIFILLNIVWSISVRAQFPPPAGQEGSTAIHADSSVIVNWANSCIVERGPVNIMSDPNPASYGSNEDATGMADNLVVSLGDGGSAVLSFEHPIKNGEGFDFVVFENALSDSFLELAFVEVSSNQSDYYRFPSSSLTSAEVQVEGFDTLDARKINNLAGKYRLLYGTPFDLEEMMDISGLDINNIKSLRIIDVIGCIQDEYANYDSEENIINDPWPTPFASCGFDLDAVGVIHQNINSIEPISDEELITVYPNPFSHQLIINTQVEILQINLFGTDGQMVYHFVPKYMSARHQLKLGFLKSGLYYIHLRTTKRDFTTKIIKK